MMKILSKTLLATILYTAGTLLAVAIAVPLLGGSLDRIGLLMSIFCPIIIGGPATFYMYWQRSSLGEMHSALDEAHRKLEAAHAELLEKSRRDFQTGFLNRETFLRELELRRADSTGALLLMDADHFKSVNDLYGHLVGDEALRVIAAAIRRASRADDIIGRIGGEEFAMIVLDADRDGAMRVAERVRREVEQIRFLAGHGGALPLTISIGATQLSPDLSVSEHMRAADIGLYAAKDGGRNRSVFGRAVLEAA